ncbi:MAG: hypothetical protein L0Z73_12705 [Gammaproteobacteria bacterium]|nr:hypothetical protein [Gammaproteobacteria bacterium]
MTHMIHGPHENQGESFEDKPEVPLSGIIYGDIIYWGTIIATLVVIAGSIMSFVSRRSYIDPVYLLTSVWQGKTVEDIWKDAVGDQPDGHWYLWQLSNDTGLTVAGIALGIFSVIPGIIGAAVYMFKEKQILFGGLAAIAALITIYATIA